MQAQNENQSRRYLRVLAENSALKAGLQLMLADPAGAAARLTVEDQLSELCSTAEIDLLLVSNLDGSPLAGVLRDGTHLAPIDTKAVRPPARGFFRHGQTNYQITSVPLDQGDEHVALLSVGERLNLADFSTPVVLLRGNKVIESSVPGTAANALQQRVAGCAGKADCELELGSETFLSLAITNTGFGDGYTIRSLVNLDSALKPVQSVIRGVFLIAGGLALAGAVIITMLSSRSIVKPIASVVAHLHQSERTGTLKEFDAKVASVNEIRELMEGFNRATAAIRRGEQNLHQAYVEFVGSLASAIDARDRYTAGHSGRVCRFSHAIAEAMNFRPDELADLRIGALLHDIGKIGIPDAVLQKPGRLTDDEYNMIRQHPEIGRRILEGVHGFAPYLSIVELHHENWDGTGYPHGLRGEEVPLAARIVHVADAFDAMTSDRPYRRGMRASVALDILLQNAGTQFDPLIVEVFAGLVRDGLIEPIISGPDQVHELSLQGLAAALAEPKPDISPVHTEISKS
jgi:HD-GYP domain-containing protein (c-di-GMP phosphodiesterase class II)